MQLNISKKVFLPQMALALFVAILWSYNILLPDISMALGRILRLGWFADVLIILSLAILLVISFPILKKRIRLIDVFVYILFWIFVIFQMIQHPENSELITENIPFMCFLVFPFFFYGLIIDIRQQQKYIYYVSLLTIAIEAFYILFIIRDRLAEEALIGDQIVTAYATLPHVLIAIWYSFKKTNIINISITILGLFLMASLGNRGSVLSILVFLLVYIIFISGKNNIKLMIFLMLLLVLGYYFQDEIFMGLYGVIKEAGLSTSLFDRVMEDRLIDSNGRDALFIKALNAIDQQNFGGYGIFSDRRMIGNYCHNIIMEMIMDFGLFFGIIIISLLLFFIVHTFLTTKNSDIRTFIAILFCPSIIKLMVSGSYLVEPYFFILLGYLISARRSVAKKKVDKRNQIISKKTINI